jgi:hypothetical protein
MGEPVIVKRANNTLMGENFISFGAPKKHNIPMNTNDNHNDMSIMVTIM